MSKDLFMVCWIGIVSALLWEGGRSPAHLLTLFACLASAGLEAGNGEKEAVVLRGSARLLVFLAFVAGLSIEAYFGTIRFLR